MRKWKNVFSLKMTVVYLTVKSSFPRTQNKQLPPSLKKQTLFTGRGSMSEERPNACMIFLPTELYVGLIKKMAKLEIGKSAALLDAVNDSLFKEGFISEDVYEKFKQKYRKPLMEVVKEKEEPSIVEIQSAKLEVQKSTVEVRKHIDYSKLSDDELLERYRKALLLKDVVEPNLIQFEAKKRGYQFKEDYDGNVRIVNIG